LGYRSDAKKTGGLLAFTRQDLDHTLADGTGTPAAGRGLLTLRTRRRATVVGWFSEENSADLEPGAKAAVGQGVLEPPLLQPEPWSPPRAPPWIFGARYK